MRIAAALLIAAIFLNPPGRASADARADSSALIGTWRWERSEGGLMGARETPPPTGWSRVLYLHRDGTYAYWEQDSVANYLLCKGRYAIHLGAGLMGSYRRASLWVELAGWQFDDLPSELVTFLGRDTIEMYPGGRNIGVADALTHTYVREALRQELGPTGRPDSLAARRPPRVRTELPSSYSVDLEPQMRGLRFSAGPFFEWMDWQYPAAARKGYAYAHNQIPSAVIGDFDGDDSMDVAIHGSTGYAESKVLCLLSNHGHPKSFLLLSEPTLLGDKNAPKGNGFQEPHPTLFLKVLLKGQAIQDSLGKALLLPHDAILVVRPEGYATPYYYAGEAFRRAKARPDQQWDPSGPRE